MEKDVVLKVDDLKIYFYIDRKCIKAVNGVSFTVRKGKTLGIVGESGCGKSVTALALMQLIPKSAKIESGEIIYNFGPDIVSINKLPKNGKVIRSIRGKEMAMIFQDPTTSLNPVYKVGFQVMENLCEHEKLQKKELWERTIKIFNELGIPNADLRINDYPHQFSGGMRQRVMIAMAMICNPKILIADEPTTALDVTIQAQILDLMKKVQQTYGTSIIFITHNMGIIAEMADDVAVMYLGKIVEIGKSENVLVNPQHPYTRALLKSVPVLGIGRGKRLEPIKGSTPNLEEIQQGCAFLDRCDIAGEECLNEPAQVDLGGGHLVRCWKCKGGRSFE